MRNITKTQTVKADRSIKKEGLKSLKVRTDLKGGMAKSAGLAICSGCHGCGAKAQ